MSHQDHKNKGKDRIDAASAILTLSDGLLAEVSPELRAAVINWNDEEIQITFYYDGEISEDDHESAECAATQVISHFPDYQFKIDILRWDSPRPIPRKKGVPVFMRTESELNNDQDPKDFEKLSNFIAKFYTSDRLKALLSTNTSLLGEISPCLRKVKVGWNDGEVRLYFYYDGEISEDDRKSTHRIASKVFENFPNRKTLLDVIRLDYPVPIPETESLTVYSRKEPRHV